MTRYFSKKKAFFLLSVVSLLMGILNPAICLAEGDKIFKENNEAVVVVIAYDVIGKAISQGSGLL